jgi:hypothetical protein
MVAQCRLLNVSVPRLWQAASLVAVVLGCLPRLGSCAHIAARLVRSLAAGRPGRAALAGGSGRWCDGLRV